MIPVRSRICSFADAGDEISAPMSLSIITWSGYLTVPSVISVYAVENVLSAETPRMKSISSPLF